MLLKGGRSGWDVTLEEGVSSGALQEGGTLAYRCQGLTCETKYQGRRYWDLVPLILYAENGSGRTRGLCAKCWTEHNGGVSSARSLRSEPAQHRKKKEGFTMTRLLFVGSNK